MVSDSTVIDKMTTGLIEKIPATISEMGISADLTKVFQKHAFVVLKLQVKAADKLQLFKATKGEAYAEKFAELLGCLEFLELHDAKEKIDITVLDKVHDALIVKLNDVIPAKMQENGITVDCCVCSSADQAGYLFERLET